MHEIVQSVERSLCILEVLSDYDEGLGITELSEKLELHKSTVHRLLNTLIQKGYIVQNASNNKYGLTLKLFELGNKKVEGLDLVTISKPHLKELMEITNEVVHLAVYEGKEIIYISKVEPQKSIQMYTRIGMRKPMYCTALGKAIMSHMDEQKVDDIWKNSDIKKLTENTIVDLDVFKKELGKIRNNGYSIDEQEVELGIRCLATTIRDHKNRVCGAISLSGSILTFTEEKVDEFSRAMLECADKISRELGYRN